MVGDGDGRVTPGDGPLDDVLCLSEGIHQGHTSVEVELHSLFRGIVLLLGLVRRLNDEGFQNHIVVESVQVQTAGDLQVHARLDPIHNGGGLLGRHELVHPDGGGVVGDIKAHHPGVALFQFLVLHGKDIALDGDHAHVQFQGVHGDGLFLDLSIAENSIGRENPLRLMGGLGLLHGLLAKGLSLAEGPLLLAHGGLDRGRLRFRFRHGFRFRHRLGLRLRLGLLLTAGGRLRGHGPQTNGIHLVEPGQIPLNVSKQVLGRQNRAQQINLDGTCGAVQDSTADHPGFQIGQQVMGLLVGQMGMVGRKHLKKGWVSF